MSLAVDLMPALGARVACRDPRRLARFWMAVIGGGELSVAPQGVRLRLGAIDLTFWSCFDAAVHLPKTLPPRLNDAVSVELKVLDLAGVRRQVRRLGGSIYLDEPGDGPRRCEGVIDPEGNLFWVRAAEDG